MAAPHTYLLREWLWIHFTCDMPRLGEIQRRAQDSPASSVGEQGAGNEDTSPKCLVPALHVFSAPSAPQLWWGGNSRLCREDF